MINTKSNPVVRCFPSLTDVAFLMPIVFLFLRLEGARTLLGDGDTGWHIRAGEWMLQNGRIPHTDFFSYTMPGRPWFAWEWLWELSFGWLHQHWGMPAVLLGCMLILCLTYALLFRLVRRSCGNAFLAVGVTGVAAAGSSLHWLARPHLVTLLFVVLFAWTLELAGAGRRRLLWLLPVLMVIWTNVHGGFLSGFLILAAYAAGELLTWLLEADAARGRAALNRAWSLLAVTAVCVASTFVNPYTYHLHVHVFQYLRDPWLWQSITEFQPLSFRGPIAVIAEPAFVLAVLSVAWNVYRRRFGLATLVLGWAHLAVFSVRNFPIFLLVSAPAAAETLAELLRLLERAPLRGWIPRLAARFDEVAAEFGAMDRIPRLHLVSAAAFGLLILAFQGPARPAKLQAEYDPSRYPAKALPLLRSPGIQRIFTHDEWGDYLIYNLYPLKKVFVDGRSDFYGSAFDEKYLDVMRVKNGWEQNLSRYSVDTILLPVDESLTGALKQSRRWRVVYDDGMAIVFRSQPALDLARPEEEHRATGVLDNDMRKAGTTASRDSSLTPVHTPRTRS